MGPNPGECNLKECLLLLPRKVSSVTNRGATPFKWTLGPCQSPQYRKGQIWGLSPCSVDGRVQGAWLRWQCGMTEPIAAGATSCFLIMLNATSVFQISQGFYLKLLLSKDMTAWWAGVENSFNWWYCILLRITPTEALLLKNTTTSNFKSRWEVRKWRPCQAVGQHRTVIGER